MSRHLDKICTIEDCGDPHHARGFCRAHYQQWWREQNSEKVRGYRNQYNQYRIANPEKVRKQRRKSYLVNKEKRLEGVRKWQEANSDKVREITRKWRQANPERVRERDRIYRLANLEKAREIGRKKTAKRRALKHRVLNNLSIKEAKAILARGCFFGRLEDCEGPLCIAHDIPISKGGNTTRANVFCLCRRHNSQMRTKDLSQILMQLEIL